MNGGIGWVPAIGVQGSRMTAIGQKWSLPGAAPNVDFGIKERTLEQNAAAQNGLRGANVRFGRGNRPAPNSLQSAEPHELAP